MERTGTFARGKGASARLLGPTLETDQAPEAGDSAPEPCLLVGLRVKGLPAGAPW